jgi:O-methyltransferase
LIAQALTKLKVDSKLYLADTFTGVAKASDSDSCYRGGEHSNTSIDIVNKLLKKADLCIEYLVLPGLFPDETAKMLPLNLKLRMVHIDVDVYLSAREVFYFSWPKMVIGGMVIFDDYGFMGCDGVTKLIEELKTEINDGIFLYNINGHSIVIKV